MRCLNCGGYLYIKSDFCPECEEKLKNPMYRPKVISVDGISEEETDLILQLINHFRELRKNRKTPK